MKCFIAVLPAVLFLQACTPEQQDDQASIKACVESLTKRLRPVAARRRRLAAAGSGCPAGARNSEPRAAARNRRLGRSRDHAAAGSRRPRGARTRRAGVAGSRGSGGSHRRGAVRNRQRGGAGSRGLADGRRPGAARSARVGAVGSRGSPGSRRQASADNPRREELARRPGSAAGEHRRCAGERGDRRHPNLAPPDPCATSSWRSLTKRPGTPGTYPMVAHDHNV